MWQSHYMVGRSRNLRRRVFVSLFLWTQPLLHVAFECGWPDLLNHVWRQELKPKNVTPGALCLQAMRVDKIRWQLLGLTYKARKMEDRQTAQRCVAAGLTLVPMVVEILRGWGPAAQNFFRILA